MVATTGDRRRDVPVWETGRPGGVRQGGPGGGARRPGRPGGPLGQGPAVIDTARGWSWPRCRPGPILATPWSARGWRISVRGPGWPPGRCAGGPSWPGCARTSPSTGLRGNIATRLGRSRRAARWWWPPPPCTAWAWPIEPPRSCPSPSCCPRWGRGPSPSSAGHDDAATRRPWPTIDDPAAGMAVTAERAFLARLGGGCDLPVGAFATPVSDDALRIEGLLASADGRVLLCARRHRTGGRSGADWARRWPRSCWPRAAPSCPSIGGPAVTVYLVGAGPGDPGLLTVRGAELLGEADVVVHDRLADASLLELAPAVGGADRRREGARRARSIRTRSTRCSSRHGRAGRRVVRLEGRGPVRVRARRRGDPGPPGRGGARSRWCPASRPPSPCPPTPACRSPTGAWPPPSPWSPATAVTPSTGRPTGRRWPRRAARSWC